jgi:hypothetical protein
LPCPTFTFDVAIAILIGAEQMAELMPDRLSSPVDKDRKDFTIYSGEWAIGRIYEQRGAAQRADRERIARAGATPLVVALAEQQAGSVTVLVTTALPPPTVH